MDLRGLGGIIFVMMIKLLLYAKINADPPKSVQIPITVLIHRNVKAVCDLLKTQSEPEESVMFSERF